MKIAGTFDMECAAWSRFAVASTYEPTLGSVIHRSISSLVDHMLARSGNWYAHAGGVYDMLAVAEEIRRRHLPCTVDLSGHRVSRIQCGRLMLRDSWALVPLPLDVAASIAGESAPVFPFACRCGLGCAGFCTIRPNDKRAELATYCAEDSRVLYRVLCEIEAFAERVGITLKGTLGASAWATARDALGIQNCEMAPAIWRSIRRAYFGGRVTIVRPHAAGPGVHYDIASAYPASLAKCELPTGDMRALGSREAAACLARQRPGVYDCTIDIPADTMFPALPLRLKNERTAYPIGRVSGTWVEPEIRSAVENGATIVKVDSALVWSQTERIFAPVIDRWYSFRRAVGKQSALGQWLRLVANSLTGKLAERPDRRSVRMYPGEIKICNMKRPCSVERCSGRCGAYEQLDRNGAIWSVPFYRPAVSGHVHWAAYLTAHTRGVWLEGANKLGDQVVYGDTDSIWALGRKPPGRTGSALGAWEFKNAWSEWQCVAPKSYRFRDPTRGIIVRTAGLAITDDDWTRGHAVTDRGVLGFIEAARSLGSPGDRRDVEGGLFRRAHRSFSLSDRARRTGVYGDRVLDPFAGITYPAPHGKEENG